MYFLKGTIRDRVKAEFHGSLNDPELEAQVQCCQKYFRILFALLSKNFQYRIYVRNLRFLFFEAWIYRKYNFLRLNIE